ncbi:unnamed protein product [Ixodes persulcatus]
MLPNVLQGTHVFSTWSFDGSHKIVDRLECGSPLLAKTTMCLSNR